MIFHAFVCICQATKRDLENAKNAINRFLCFWNWQNTRKSVKRLLLIFNFIQRISRNSSASTIHISKFVLLCQKLNRQDCVVSGKRKWRVRVNDVHKFHIVFGCRLHVHLSRRNFRSILLVCLVNLWLSLDWTKCRCTYKQNPKTETTATMTMITAKKETLSSEDEVAKLLLLRCRMLWNWLRNCFPYSPHTLLFYQIHIT